MIRNVESGKVAREWTTMYLSQVVQKLIEHSLRKTIFSGIKTAKTKPKILRKEGQTDRPRCGEKGRQRAIKIRHGNAHTHADRSEVSIEAIYSFCCGGGGG